MATSTLDRARARVRAVPATMKAAAIDDFGPPEALTLHTVPVPTPAPHEVLIALHAAGVGVWDAAMRGGWWPEGKPTFPRVLGTDGAGVVAVTGAKVRRFRAGDRVWAYDFLDRKGGFYAEYVAVDAEHVGRVPEQLDLLHAGAAAVTGLTALQGIDDQLKLRSGETLLIVGASGAVGSLAIQLAKRKHARVLAAVRTRDASALVRRLGADVALDVGSKKALDRLQALAPDGIDAVLALAGGEALEMCLDLVRPGGRVAYPNGIEPAPARRRKMTFRTYDAEASPTQLARLARAVGEARLRVPIASTYPLAQAAKAHARVERGHVLGRVVLEIRRDRA